MMVAQLKQLILVALIVEGEVEYVRSGGARCAVSLVLVLAVAGCGGGGMDHLAPGGRAPAVGNIRDTSSIRSVRGRLARNERVASGRIRAQDYAQPSNVTTADPPVEHPDESPCTVTLFSGVQFTNFTPAQFQYSPTCYGPWAKVVLDADFAVTAGRQFDRTASIWLDGTNIYFGTTAEPSKSLAPSWHVEKDVTDLSPIFETASTGETVLGNVVNSTYTGIISATARLEFYPASRRYPAADAPDSVYPLSGGPLGDNQYLTTPSQPLTATYTLPQNVRAAYLDVYLQSQIGDEFWYTCFPNDLAAQLNNCGNTAFREGDVAIDGQPAGVVPVYPWIFTGGIDPYLWRPIPGVETLNFHPYRVDLTPFAGVLSNGQPHTINVTVFNNGNYFAANGALLVYPDHGSSHVTGGILHNATSLQPSPSVVENVTTNSQGVATGTVDVRSTHVVDIAGYVNTSAGRIETQVREIISFDNKQKIDANTAGTLFDQKIDQDTKILSTTTTRRSEDRGSHHDEDFEHNGTSSVTRVADWPLSLVYDFAVNPDGSAAQTATVSQGKSLLLDRHEAGSGRPFHLESSNNVDATDTLTFFAQGGYAPSNGKTTQTYRVMTSNGFCWNKTVSATTSTLTEDSGGRC